ncbi:MAG: type II secretion system minor pseudopilin GspI [Halieaceae bacterium]|jgi:general secretion pathway protein I|nr:type II secretion system minor pseudopilin GspI [Halieaceae bacterium]
MRCERSRGFTLIEVMVALAIVAIAVPALLFTLDQQLDGTAYLRDRSLAQIVASNRLSELRLALRNSQRRLQGTLSGSETLAGREWYWRMTTTATEVPRFSRVEIRVSDTQAEGASSLYSLAAFVRAGDAE